VYLYQASPHSLPTGRLLRTPNYLLNPLHPGPVVPATVYPASLYTRVTLEHVHGCHSDKANIGGRARVGGTRVMRPGSLAVFTDAHLSMDLNTGNLWVNRESGH